MGQIIDKDNSFRNAIINGLISSDVKFSDHKLYPNLNYGLIIKQLNLDYNFREPIRYFFKGFPYHVGIIRNNDIYSFCPDLREPHRGTLKKDIIKESLNEWDGGEIFWFINSDIKDSFITVTKNGYKNIESRLIDLLHVKAGLLDLDEFNRRHGTSLKMLYNLLSNNCTDVALSILIGQTRCFQIESIIPIIIKLSDMKEITSMIPEYGKIWLQDFKYIK